MKEKDAPSSKHGKSYDDSKRFARMQNFLGNTLLYGVLLSTAIVVTGLILMAVTASTGYGCDNSADSLSCILTYKANSIPHGDYPSSLFSLAAGLPQLKPFAVIELGILVLLATPVFRVFASLVLFSLEKDKPFILITLFVFLVLLFSFFVAPEISLFQA
ncbi:MAG: DUF1634 domain-containing protein [Nitrososphaerales archaeon]